MLTCDVCSTSDENLEMLRNKDFTICENCITTAYDIVSEGKARRKREEAGVHDLGKIIKELASPEDEAVALTPKQIKERLDEFVIGQTEAKKILSVAAYNHFQRINNIENENVVFDKSNALLIGPSGSGKTLLAKTIAKTFNIPIVIADATSLTQAGYIGDDVEGILTRLVQAAEGDIHRAEKGIVFIDEIDKIAKSSKAGSSGKDVSGEGVQQALLKIIEGAEVSFPLKGSKKNGAEPTGMINTENILFICSGAFSNLPDVIKGRLNKKKKMGFEEISEKEEKTEDPMEKLEIDDLIEFGFIPEILGRLPVVSTLKELTEEELLLVLTEPKNSIITQYKELLQLDRIELEFSKETLDCIVQECIANKTGVRNLKSTVEGIMLEIVYNIEDYRGKKITITKEYFENRDLAELSVGETLAFDTSATREEPESGIESV